MNAAAEQSNFGSVIREARLKRGWSQLELGERAGLSRPTVARVEADHDVTVATIARLANALALKLELTETGLVSNVADREDEN